MSLNLMLRKLFSPSFRTTNTNPCLRGWGRERRGDRNSPGKRGGSVGPADSLPGRKSLQGSPGRSCWFEAQATGPDPRWRRRKASSALAASDQPRRCRGPVAGLRSRRAAAALIGASRETGGGAHGMRRDAPVRGSVPLFFPLVPSRCNSARPHPLCPLSDRGAAFPLLIVLSGIL